MEENRISKKESSFNKMIKFIFSSHNYEKSDTLSFVDKYNYLNVELKKLFDSNDDFFYIVLIFLNKRSRLGYFMRNKMKNVRTCNEIKTIYENLEKNKELDDSFKKIIFEDIRIEKITLNYILEILMISDTISIDTPFYIQAKRNVVKNFCSEDTTFDVLEFKTKITLGDGKENDIYRFLQDYIKMDLQKFIDKYFVSNEKKEYDLKKTKNMIEKKYKNEMILIG
jgi:hypothetical protein